ncbi:unnamed protein product [Rotaria sp. Silwood2]|nr:unnamed protein product [Rotaria sp. Silwood2]CAF2829945.1 unnamed protein product [Rotaria sp. Silwood2]CAF3353789.1 unnamed protein product [Rotaria sp. Silwood2]CAF4301829.1 unnamed protein product [Rotaria sp. Silwood2]CAF4440005.1 unnamed protein product [Rotaria sp. Silwood2]
MRSSKCHRSVITNCQKEQNISSENISIYFIRSATNSMLSTLSTNSTVNDEAPVIILQKSLASSPSSLPNVTLIIAIHQTERLLSNLIPKQNINPLIPQHH